MLMENACLIFQTRRDEFNVICLLLCNQKCATSAVSSRLNLDPSNPALDRRLNFSEHNDEHSCSLLLTMPSHQGFSKGFKIQGNNL
jgi:hypothetical protein